MDIILISGGIYALLSSPPLIREVQSFGCTMGIEVLPRPALPDRYQIKIWLPKIPYRQARVKKRAKYCTEMSGARMEGERGCVRAQSFVDSKALSSSIPEVSACRQMLFFKGRDLLPWSNRTGYGTGVRTLFFIEWTRHGTACGCGGDSLTVCPC
jgi:hypothetical protein